eukprot:365032-Chlamydomonas_euryale.AAC.10
MKNVHGDRPSRWRWRSWRGCPCARPARISLLRSALTFAVPPPTELPGTKPMALEILAGSYSGLSPCAPLANTPPPPQVKLTALEILAGLSGTPDGIGALKSRLDKLLVFAMRLVPVPAAAPGASEASAGALKVLVNLSQDDSAAARMVEQRAVARVMDYIREGACPHARLMCMLLSNLTAREPGCEQLLQLGQDRLQGLNVAVLLKKFVMSGINYGMGGGADGDEDPFEHVAAVLTNLTRLEAARRLLLEDGRGLLPVRAVLACKATPWVRLMRFVRRERGHRLLLGAERWVRNAGCEKCAPARFEWAGWQAGCRW